jgi:hypothetical protein
MVLERLVRAALRLIDESVPHDAVRFEAIPKSHHAVLRPSRWSDRAEERRLRDLVRFVAERLSSGTPTFVVWHFDGDVPWSQRVESVNVRRFEEVIQTRVRRILSTTQRPVGIDHLLRMVPFYSVEAWLFQNFRKLERMELDGSDRARVSAWRERREGLDEISKVKESLSIRDRRNAELAKGWPAADVEAVGASFAATMRDWRANRALTQALADLHP